MAKIACAEFSDIFSVQTSSMQPKLLMAAFFSLLFLHVSAQQKGYYLTPSISGNTIVFSAEGDLWKYDLSTGATIRLTTDQGREVFPAISPDAKQVVFSGEYEGVRELYQMDINGGVPKRLTYDFDAYSIFAAGWTRDNKIIYRTSKYSGLPSAQLFTLDPVTGNRTIIPLAEAADGCFDDAGILYFTRFENQGSKTKRYKGGLIEQIWKFDGKQEAICLTGNFDGTSTRPMYYGGRIYFISDRDGTMNIWSMDLTGKDLKQQTFSKGWDVKFASMSDSRIAYQKGADIWLCDVKANQDKLLDITLQSDFDQRKPRWIKSPVQSITYSDLSPSGNYVAIISRGRLFVSPAKSDRWVEVTRRSGIRFREVHFLDEKTLTVLSDQSGEGEIWSMPADGSGTAKQLTKNSKTLIKSFSPSPDGKYIGYTDKNEVLRMVETATGTVKFRYDSSYGGTFGTGWSPDSRYMHFSNSLPNQNSQLCVVDVRNGKMIPVSSTRLNSYNAAWTGDHKWFYFLSERNLQTKVPSPWGPRQPEPYYTETENIYAFPLDTAAKFPFLQTDSWLTDSIYNPVAAEKKTAEKEKKAKKKPSPPIAADFDWNKAMQTLYKVPTKSGNLDALDVASDDILYWMDNGTGEDENSAKLFALKIQESKKYEPTEVASAVSGFNLSANKKKLLIVFANKTMVVVDANGQKAEVEKSKLELENWNFQVNPPEDWKEIFDDAWLMMRDYFYDRDMHKVNWVDIRSHYEPLLSRITDRYELDDLIADMVGELSALHTFVVGGEKRRSPDLIMTGFLGAVLRKTASGLLIEHIYQHDPDYPETSSPLNKPELSIKEGDVITAVNNVPLTAVKDIAELLANKVNIPVKLSLLNRQQKPYDQVVRPFSAGSEAALRYTEWEMSRRHMVDSVSREDIGYVHLRAMGGSDMDDFVKQFYPVFTRKGLILDVRHNNGGNIDSWVLEKLLRKAWMYWQSRAGGPTWNMPFAFRGPMVILCDQATASDGEAVSEGFRRLGLGKVIGMRTWGGEIWLSFRNRLVDNGIASAAETGVYGPEGKWLIEGRGVEPDIIVDNLPFETFQGKDKQLSFAIEYLKKEILEKPVVVPPAPAHPDKSFKY